MALTFKTPSQVADEYLLHLKSLKPSVNIAQVDTDWWIRSRVVGGMMAGVYGDQKKLADDPFPQSSRRDALLKHLDLYFGGGFLEAQKSNGEVLLTGPTGTAVSTGLQLVYDVTGNTYTVTEGGTIDAATGTVFPLESINSGQDQNLLEGTVLSIPSPPAGLDNTGTIYNGPMADGKNEETEQEASERILNRVRAPSAGGTVADYKTWAKEASPSVTDANIIRYLYGLGTIGIVIAAGTQDIDEALDNGDPVVRTPSNELVNTVQSYINAVKPETDCAHVLSPEIVTVNVTVKCRFASGNKDTVITGQTLTQGQLVQREVKRAIYKTPPGGRQFGSSGFVVCSEIEEVIDVGLSALPHTEGSYAKILLDRQVQDLAPSGPNLYITNIQMAEPGTITVEEF